MFESPRAPFLTPGRTRRQFCVACGTIGVGLISGVRPALARTTPADDAELLAAVADTIAGVSSASSERPWWAAIQRARAGPAEAVLADWANAIAPEAERAQFMSTVDREKRIAHLKELCRLTESASVDARLRGRTVEASVEALAAMVPRLKLARPADPISLLGES